MPDRNIYLDTVSVEEARRRFNDRALASSRPRGEAIRTRDALGRVLFEPAFALFNSPLRDSAAMDGIAAISSRTRGAAESSPVELALGADFEEVDTGDAVRPPFDAVIMAEDVQYLPSGNALIRSAAPPWQHVRPVGEDIVQGEMILPRGTAIRPVGIGALLAGGVSTINVFTKPIVSIIPTGDEMVRAGDAVPDGGIVESNSAMLAALTVECGGEPIVSDIVPDDYASLIARVSEAIRVSDVVLVCAGTSAGRDDYTSRALRELGEVVVHGVAMKPGKPVVLGFGGGKPVVGVPGYPVSAYLAFEAFAAPVVRGMSGLPEPSDATARATLTRRLASSLKHREYVRVSLGLIGGRIVATPLPRGAGSAMSLVKAGGLLAIPRDSEGVEAGADAEVIPLKPLSSLDRAVVCIGSHDPVLDSISDIMPRARRGYSFASTHVGSMGGLMALRGGEAHVAPIHLPDDGGAYNASFVERLFPNKKMALIKLVGRVQGIMVAKGNPLGIAGVRDIVGARFVNRQLGSGTRSLFDILLKRERVDPELINGYGREAATHMAVAAAVKSGSADAGIGVFSAASAMGLEFIPVGNEEYDFALERDSLELPCVRALLDVIACDEFKSSLRRLGGYDDSRLGELVYIGV